MAIVYKHTRLDTNEIFYIGIGGTEKRAYRKCGRNKFWKRITSKTDYRVDILYSDITWDEACEKEVELIALYGRRDLGQGTLCNLTNGGEGTVGFKFSEESLQKISESNMGKHPATGIPMPDTTKQGLLKYLVGHSTSEEAKRKIGDGNRGKKLSTETRDKMSKSRLGYKCSEQVKENMSKPKSESHKQKLREAWVLRKQKQVA